MATTETLENLLAILATINTKGKSAKEKNMDILHILNNYKITKI